MSRSFCILRAGSERNVLCAPTPERNSLVSSRLSVEMVTRRQYPTCISRRSCSSPSCCLLSLGQAFAGEHQHEGIALLHSESVRCFPRVVRKFVVGKDRTRNDVGSHDRTLSMWSPASFTASSAVRPRSRATMYAAYQSDQWCFGAVAS